MAPRRAGPGSEAQYTLELLGPPRVIGEDGEKVSGIPARTYGLLAYLALQPRPVSREQLAPLLWPSSDRKKALHSLRQLLHTLRKVLPGVVVDDPDVLSVGASLKCTDVELVSQELEGQRLDRALDRWRGPFMERWAPAVSWELEEWVERMGSRMSLLLKTSVSETASGLLVSGQPGEAEQLLSRALAMIPEHEELVLLHAEALACCGRVPQAEAALAQVELDSGDYRVQKTLKELGRWRVDTRSAPFANARRVEA